MYSEWSRMPVWESTEIVENASETTNSLEIRVTAMWAAPTILHVLDWCFLWKTECTQVYDRMWNQQFWLIKNIFLNCCFIYFLFIFVHLYFCTLWEYVGPADLIVVGTAVKAHPLCHSGSIWQKWHQFKVQNTYLCRGKVKKLTSVSFAFTHTYTPVKTNFFPFFPKRTWKFLKNVQKRKN